MIISTQVQANPSVIDNDETFEPSYTAASAVRQYKIAIKSTFMRYFCGGHNSHCMSSMQPGTRNVIIAAKLRTTLSAA